MRLKFVCNWNSDYNIYNIVNDIWNIDGEYELTYGDDYTHLVIFNRYDRNQIRVSKENVFGFIHEPYWSNFYDKNLPSYCNKVFYWQPSAFPNYDNIVKTPFICLHHLFPKPIQLHEIQYIKNNTKDIINTNFIKDKKLSIIVSSINQYENHVYHRFNFVKELLKSDIEFDMYGNGWDLNDSRYKGYITNKLDGLKNYKYSISLENTSLDGYISEKFIDPILCNTIPIYNGHPSIFNYYPNSCEYLDFDNHPIDRIKFILEHQKDISEYDINKAKSLYINEYNPMTIIKKIINQ